jgi:amidohydrolase
VFGSVHSGDAANVIPSVAVLTGSVRTHDRSLWDFALPLLEASLSELLEGSGARWAIDYTRGVPPVVNDGDATALLGRTAREVLGAGAVVPTEHSWGGDSFGWYLDVVPGSYARLGTHRANDQGPRFDLHSSTFDVDEGAIAVGVRVLVAAALAWLQGPGRGEVPGLSLARPQAEVRADFDEGRAAGAAD